MIRDHIRHTLSGHFKVSCQGQESNVGCWDGNLERNLLDHPDYTLLSHFEGENIQRLLVLGLLVIMQR